VPATVIVTITAVAASTGAVDAIEIESLIEQWMKKRLRLWLEIGHLKSLGALEALWELSGSSLQLRIYLLDVQSLPHLPFGAPICLLAPPFAFWHPHSIGCAFLMPMTKGHAVQSSHPTPTQFFFLRNIPTTIIFGSQKGPHLER